MKRLRWLYWYLYALIDIIKFSFHLKKRFSIKSISRLCSDFAMFSIHMEDNDGKEEDR